MLGICVGVISGVFIFGLYACFAVAKKADEDLEKMQKDSQYFHADT